MNRFGSRQAEKSAEKGAFARRKIKLSIAAAALTMIIAAGGCAKTKDIDHTLNNAGGTAASATAETTGGLPGGPSTDLTAGPAYPTDETTSGLPGGPTTDLTAGPDDPTAETTSSLPGGPTTDLIAATAATADPATPQPTEPAALTPAATTAPTEKTATAAPAATTAPTEKTTTAAPTARPTPTSAPTEKPTPEPTEYLEVVDFGSGEAGGILTYLAQARYCTTELVDDAEEGKVLRITAKPASSTGTYVPSVFFKYKEYCAAAGYLNVNVAEKTGVILKVKTQNAHDRRFGLLGTGTLNESTASRKELFARVPAGDGWHYIWFDYTGVSRADSIAMFRMNFEQYALEAGESILISELRFVNAEEAAAIVDRDVYPAGGDSAEIRVMQFNIQTENGNSAPFIVRAELYRRLVDQLMPDVIGMEEVTTTWRKWLDEYVFNDSYAGVGEARTTGGEANPIYYRKDKYELLDSGTFWLSDTPDVPGSYLENVNYPRICTWVLLRDRTTGNEFVHMNTHLDHNGQNSSSVGNEIRKSQLGVIVKFAQRFKDKPMFLTGDLNNRRTTSAGNTYALIKIIEGDSKFKDSDGTKYSIKLSDARLLAPVTVDEQHTATMTAQYDESSASYNPSREPIDYIFFNPANTEALTYETFLISQNNYEISDHLPVFAKFRFTAG